MSPDDLQRLAMADLLRLEASLRHEVARRGISRTATALGGELAEHLAQRVYGGDLSAPATAAFDLIDAQGRRVQVKSRTLPPGEQRHFAFKSLDFDLAVCLRFDRKTNGLEWAREFRPSEIRSLASDHADGLRLSTRRASEHGQDLTDAFRTALDGMGVGDAWT
ncbi:hypothetical protein [Zhihengliuella sp.]|uniref:hypothetical protein n=1 Tax=Zhihengliuella sp. TaxID=1954483 RepID=UPI0028112E7E|nr:hypothetical protein [Zhihengliuella sp.]